MGDQHEGTIPEALDGERVDRVVSIVTGVSRSEASRLVDAGSVCLDGAQVSSRSLRAVAGQRLVVEVDDPLEPESLVADHGIVVVVAYEDDDVAVVDKPPGLVVHPGAGNRTGTLAHGLLARFPELACVGDAHRPGIVHRLDRGTSGLLIVARSTAAHRALSRDLAARRVERSYVALVEGAVESPAGLVDAPIGRSGADPTKMAVVADGRPARTRYAVTGVFDDGHGTRFTRLDVGLETGRTHQIRVHMAAIGHPVAGDTRYGARSPLRRLERPFLHAAHLRFRHPTTGDVVDVTSALPGDLVAVLGDLR